MSLDVRVSFLREPLLEFGASHHHADPKVGLVTDGPFSLRYHGGQPGPVRVGLVGSPEMLDAAIRWFERCQQRILSQKGNRRRFPDYPGFETIFRTPLHLADRWNVEIPNLELARLLMRPDLERFGAVVQTYADGVSSLAQREMGPNVVMCCLPDSIIETCWSVARGWAASRGSQRRARSRERGEQLTLPFDRADVEEDSDSELVFRTFRRALKARAMTARTHLPIQIAHNHLFEDGPDKDDPATRAWSVSVGLFFKAGGLPWRLANMPRHVCFVGISFHRLRTTKNEAVYASMAQAFSTEIEGFVLRGERVPWRPDLQPYLTTEQAERLGHDILAKYRERAGRPPVRVTLHKTTQFSPDEREGFCAAFDQIPAVELITLQPSDLRLFPSGDYPPRRGSACTINGTAHFLYTTGFYDDWGTYPGPHVPQPIRIIGDTKNLDLRRVYEETLGLTKMNWNSASIGGRDPVTLRMSREVGPIMAEVPDDQEPELSYRYYM